MSSLWCFDECRPVTTTNTSVTLAWDNISCENRRLLQVPKLQWGTQQSESMHVCASSREDRPLAIFITEVLL